MKIDIRNYLVRQKLVIVILLPLLLATVFSVSQVLSLHTENLNIKHDEAKLSTNLNNTKKILSQSRNELVTLKMQDQYQRNEKLEDEIKDIETTYGTAVTGYENLLKLKEKTSKTDELDKLFALALSQLSERNFTSSAATLADMQKKIDTKNEDLAASASIPANVTQSNSPPSSGYNRQSVQSSAGSFMVDIISANLNDTKVVVDTASENDCKDNCPVLPLGSYASRSGAFAAVNGPYFCPASYPSCAGKTNSFDTLLMNKNKHYFNSDNNIYSVVPAVIFSGNSSRYVSRSLEWGRDTGVDAVIANQPLLLQSGNVVFNGDGEAKRAGKGTRAFIASKDSMVYIGVVYNANTADMAQVLKTLGMSDALNLDSGGSIALWSNGRYVAGPGRDLPFGILLVHK